MFRFSRAKYLTLAAILAAFVLVFTFATVSTGVTRQQSEVGSENSSNTVNAAGLSEASQYSMDQGPARVALLAATAKTAVSSLNHETQASAATKTIGVWAPSKPASQTTSSHEVVNSPGNMSVASVSPVGSASVSGRVTTTQGAAVENSMVYAVNTVGGGDYWTFTSASGAYTLSQLPAGTYTFFFDASSKVTVKTLTVRENRTRVDARILLKAQIKGRVVDASGNAIANATVASLTLANPGVRSGWSFTDSSGYFYIHGLPAGAYTIAYSAEMASASYLTTMSGGKSSVIEADPVVLSEGQLLTGQNATMAAGAEIGGYVNGQAGSALARADVSIYAANNPDDRVSFTTSDASGMYVFRGIPAGNYKVFYEAGKVATGSYLPKWYSQGDDFSSAQTVTVSAGERQWSLNTYLQLGQSISGKARTASGAGIAGVWVSAVSSAHSVIFAEAQTDNAGNYTLRGLPPGTYKLRFDPFDVISGRYFETWSGGGNAFETSQFIDTRLGSVTGQNVTLVRGAQIMGVVRNSSGNPVAGAAVSLRDANNADREVSFTTSDSTGKFSFGPLAAGKYKAQAFGSWGTVGSYSSAWLGGDSFAHAATLTIATAQTKSGLAITLPRASQISGTVSNSAGRGIPIVQVTATPATNIGRSYFATTDGAGHYELNGLPAGAYKINYSFDGEWAAGYLPAWFGGQPSFEVSPSVNVGAGQSLTEINQTLTNGVLIVGHVTGEHGPIAGVAVTIKDSESGDGVGYGYSASDGSFFVGSLPSGTYKVEFSTDGVPVGSYFPTWFGGGTFADAGSLAMTAGQTYTADAVLDSAASISGRVVDASDGTGVSYAYVDSYSPSDPNTAVGSTHTDSKGYFTLTGVSAGSYRLHVRAGYSGGRDLMNQWYVADSAEQSPLKEFGDATVVNVASGSDTHVFDSRLVHLSSISGVVVNPNGTLAAGVTVFAFDSQQQSGYQATAVTDAAGVYTLTGLMPGSYKIQYEPGAAVPGSVRSTWNNAKPTFDSADAVTLGLSEQKSGVDSELLSGGIVTGRVTSKSSSKALAGVVVKLYANGGNLIGQCTSDSKGNYYFGRLNPGMYFVQFESLTLAGSYLPAFSGGATSLNNVVAFRIASSQVKVLNQALVSAATISGRVVDVHGVGIEHVTVSEFSKTVDSRWLGAGVETDSNGYYTLKGVASGGVKILFDAGTVPQPGPAYQSMWATGKATWATADVITLTAGQKRTGLNAQLVAVN